MPVAIITGASRGLGAALAAALVNQGWSVVIDARDAEALKKTTAELEGLGGTVTALAGGGSVGQCSSRISAVLPATHSTRPTSLDSATAPDAAAAQTDAVVEAWMDADAYRLYVLDTALKALEGKPVGAESSANKLFWSDLDVQIHSTALALLGERATLTDDPVAAHWLDGYLFALAGPIYAGTNEIQRNVVAERLLGLPRG